MTKRTITRRRWTDAEDALLGTDVDRAIARRLGRTVQAVKDRRLALGIEPSARQFDWTAERIALLGKLPDTALARAFGCERQTVFRKRRELKVKPARPGNTPKRYRRRTKAESDCSRHDRRPQ